MQFATWDSLFNIALLLFWAQLVVPDPRTMAFNPYLASMRRTSDVVVNFLRSALNAFPAWTVLVFIMVALVLLRGFAAPHDGRWILAFGFEALTPGPKGMVPYLAFSLLSFGAFLFKLWGLSLIYCRHSERDALFRPATGALHLLSNPFTRLPYAWRPAVLAGYGLLLALLLHSFGTAAPHPIPQLQEVFFSSGNAPARGLGLFLRCFVSTIWAWVDVLNVIVQVMILLIIGSWVGMFTSSQGIMTFCREMLDALLGPMRSHPVRLGMIDLTPLVFILIITAIQFVLRMILVSSYLILV